ncbi:MAG: hypothetical protein A4E53_04577 [Pelotomaculum sp. PtaB.Bin104]|nr:MAG: hypothetical protein A4E53_04577 [Pelotomaculum sp. PtaB.Bin104]
MLNEEITDYGESGLTDTQPIWSSTQPYDLLFCRGAEYLDWLGREQAGVLVPDQRIWVRKASGEEAALTSGSIDTADYIPQLSSDGKNLSFLRLSQFNVGSLYFKGMNSNQEIEILRGLNGEPGFYGNY